MMILNRAVLERATFHGCQVEGCADQSHEVFLHFKHSLDTPAFLVFLTANVMQYTPVEPSLIAESMKFAVEGWEEIKGKIKRKIFEQTCHPDSAVWLSYRHGSGLLTIHCYECQDVVGKIWVKG